MLTRVIVNNENPLGLKIRDARPTDSIIVEKIDGLHPPAIDLFLGDYARDGGYYSGRRVGNRNIVLTLKINPNYALDETVDGLRQMLYRAFIEPRLAGDDLELILEDDTLQDRITTGYVEKFEADPFSADLSVQISIICPNPYLLDRVEKEVLANGPTVTKVLYTGTAEAGLEIEAEFTSSSASLVFGMNGKNLTTLNYGFQQGDRVFVNSRPGEKRIQVLRAGVYTDILYSMTATSEWMQLHAPSNTFFTVGPANIKSIKYRPTHWGI
jgi:hypothetical protein